MRHVRKDGFRSGQKIRRLLHHSADRQVSRARPFRFFEIQLSQKRSCLNRHRFEGGTSQRQILVRMNVHEAAHDIVYRYLAAKHV